MSLFCICYNIFDYNHPEVPALPEAYIVHKKDDTLGYIEKQATGVTLKSYSISTLSTPHVELLDICSDLKPSALEQKFLPKNKRKKINLGELIEDPKTKHVVLNYINKKLSIFYSLIHNNHYPISYNQQRKDPVEINRLFIKDTRLKPILEFTKTQDGIEYAFSLTDEGKRIVPKNNNIKKLLNEPSWIVLNKYLLQIENLNANKLKPFFNKEKITIPKKHLKTYLEKVIVPVIKNIDVITNGFEIITCNTLSSFGIEIIQDFIQNRYVAKVIFEYQHTTFEYQNSKNTESNVLFDDNDNIKIIQTKRDPKAEQKIIDILIDMGLKKNQNLLFETNFGQDPYQILYWLTAHKSELEKRGFTITLPTIENRTVNVAPHEITFQNQKDNDWFDIKGTVNIGDSTISFSKFIPYIKTNNRFFPINEDQIFVIPQEWMTRYKKVADFGRLKNQNIKIAKSNYTLLKNVIPIEGEILLEEPPKTFTASPKLKATLRPYQKDGVQWLIHHYQNKLGACLADDMGLGKTLQTIAMLLYAKEELTPENQPVQTVRLDLFSDPLVVKTYLKALIVLPSSLLFNWAQEILKFAPHLNIVKYTGANRKTLTPYLETYDIILSSYNIVSKDIDTLKKTNFNYLVIDESQQIKNKSSKVFGAINSISASHKISLSGTPIENSLSDLWSQMEFINPGILGSHTFFKDYFQIPIEKHKDQDRIDELKTLIDPFILRRTKEQVAKDLPELSEQIIYTEMSTEQNKLYDSQKSAARNLLLGIDTITANKVHIINTLTRLRQLANHPKLLDNDTKNKSGKFIDVTNYIQTLIKSNKKVLVFSSFVSHLEVYEEWCNTQKVSYVTLTGETKSSDREKVVTEFQENESISIFFISLKAGGVGLNLTKASYVILLDPWWNPFIEKQAIARSHRIGQKNKVMVTRFIAKNTIEEKILKLQEKKKNLSDNIIDINTIPDYIEKDLADLLS
ncbi:DEAD/DEAH box helicase [Aquimarina gracilis]|uniref:DEAD/DEAH box helicase n=1 Tax=Aquimarina gracilis TaxID=874422 RepID=A0ABU5ZPY4_9FLAO|nr:DEAD/DEAH box helicase [Aquimarina gracilis]MEB3343999.1 DEAD/DEAH box helicase [Aquimarina gracilis]